MSGATIANRGKLMQPTIVREVQDSEGRVIPCGSILTIRTFRFYEVRKVTDRGRRSRDVWVNPPTGAKSFRHRPRGVIRYHRSLPT
jgi:hypothetical protein